MQIFDKCVSNFIVESKSVDETYLNYVGNIAGQLQIESSIKIRNLTVDKLGGTTILKNVTCKYIGLFGAFYIYLDGYDWGTGQRFDTSFTLNNWYCEIDAKEAILQDYLGGFTGDFWNDDSNIILKNGYISIDTDISTNDGSNLNPIVGYDPKKLVINSLYLDADKYIGVKQDVNYIGKTTKELMQQETFPVWDFDDVWIMQENRDYPRLVLLRKRVYIECKKVPLNNYRR